MEIALLPNDSLRIKSKYASLVIDPSDKTAYNAALLLRLSASDIKMLEQTVIIDGPGEYEVGGIKLTGMRIENDRVYSIVLDGIDVLIGKLSALEKLQHKLKEHHIVIAYDERVENASFITSLATNVVVFYGEKAREIATTFGKENVKEIGKYITTFDKLPPEVETIVLV